MSNFITNNKIKKINSDLTSQIQAVDSVVDSMTNDGVIKGTKIITQAEYDALPSSKTTDCIMYVVRGEKMKYNGFKIRKLKLNGETVRANLNGIDVETGVGVEGLILWLDGEDFQNIGGSNWVSKINGQNNAIPTGIAFTTSSGSDWLGGVVFDGIDDKLSVTRNNSLLTDFSVEMFIKRTADNANGVLFSGAGSPIIYLFNNVLSIYIGGIDFHTATTIPLNVKTHIFIKRTNNVVNFFINGVKLGDTVTNSAAVNNNFNIGYDSVKSWYKGVIYNLRAYNRALTDQEVQQNYVASMYPAEGILKIGSFVVGSQKIGIY